MGVNGLLTDNSSGLATGQQEPDTGFAVVNRKGKGTAGFRRFTTVTRPSYHVTRTESSCVKEPKPTVCMYSVLD